MFCELNVCNYGFRWSLDSDYNSLRGVSWPCFLSQCTMYFFPCNYMVTWLLVSVLGQLKIFFFLELLLENHLPFFLGRFGHYQVSEDLAWHVGLTDLLPAPTNAKRDKPYQPTTQSSSRLSLPYFAWEHIVHRWKAIYIASRKNTLEAKCVYCINSDEQPHISTRKSHSEFINNLANSNLPELHGYPSA